MSIRLKSLMAEQRLIELTQEKKVVQEFKDGFDLDTFLKMKSFRQQALYANNNLKRLTSGSGRIVYEIDTYKVLKLAKNTKGVEQNKAEADFYVQENWGDIIAKVLEHDDEYRWVVSERASKISLSQFKRYVGVSPDEFYKYLCTETGTVYGAVSTPSEETVAILSEDPDNFANRVIDLVTEYDMMPGDFRRLSSYGIVNDKVVIVDYGLTRFVYKNYYAWNRPRR